MLEARDSRIKKTNQKYVTFNTNRTKLAKHEKITKINKIEI